nr:uncharacterized protein LOC129524403 [Gorilla gorilla gorilla]
MKKTEGDLRATGNKRCDRERKGSGCCHDGVNGRDRMVAGRGRMSKGRKKGKYRVAWRGSKEVQREVTGARAKGQEATRKGCRLGEGKEAEGTRRPLGRLLQAGTRPARPTPPGRRRLHVSAPLQAQEARGVTWRPGPASPAPLGLTTYPPPFFLSKYPDQSISPRRTRTAGSD